MKSIRTIPAFLFRKRLPGYEIVILLAGLIVIQAILLEFPILWLNWAIMVTIGAILFRAEYRAGYPSPMSPGVMFWMGHFMVFGVGAFLYYFWATSSIVFFDETDFAWQISIINAGLLSYATTYAVASFFRKKRLADRFVRWPEIVLNDSRLYRMVAFIAIPVAVFFVFVPGYQIGAFGSGYSLDPITVISTLLFGSLSFVRSLFLVLLAFYLLAKGRKKLLVIIALAIASLGQTFQATALGGRMTIVMLFSLPVMILVAYRQRMGRLKSLVLPGLLCIGILLIYIPTAGVYRSYTGYGETYSQVEGFAGQIGAFNQSLFKVLGEEGNSEWILYLLGGRIYEPESLIVMMRAKYSNVGYGFRGWRDIFFRWVPAFIYEKGKDRGNDLLWKEGLKPILTSGDPITVVGDLYYRFGLLGVILGYAVLGVMIGYAGRLCFRISTTLSFVAFLMFSIILFRIYVVDFVNAFWMPLYDWPIGVLFAHIIFKLSGAIERKGKDFRVERIQEIKSRIGN